MTSELDLPPLYRAITLREHGDAFRHAQTIARDSGAGTLVWVRRFDTVEAAVVLEPEEPLSGARRVVYAAMSALADSIAAHCPPEKPIAFEWPDTLLLDGAILGGVRLAWPDGSAEASPPAWLVVAIGLRSAVALARQADRPGHVLDTPHQRGTSLEIEGFEMLDAATLLASFSRHLMVHLDRWHEDGFDPVGRDFLARLAPRKGLRYGFEANGDLMETPLDGKRPSHRRELAEALAAPQWLDPATGEPWL